MDSLHEQAVFIYEHGDGQIMQEKGPNGRVERTTVLSHKSVFLLAGFALENAIKAFLVYENPHWISNGGLCKNLRSHNLVSLQSQSKFIPNRNRRNRVLQAFEDGLESWARYPCSLTAEGTRDEDSLTLELWLQYLRLIRSYEKRLRELMDEPWKGPHGFSASYRFEGEVGYPPVPTLFEAYGRLSRTRLTSERAINRRQGV
tara:strand:+ start:11195 stop:11800 length:606 start_codon:yes stop_codon:yes gene_type:complete